MSSNRRRFDDSNDNFADDNFDDDDDEDVNFGYEYDEDEDEDEDGGGGKCSLITGMCTGPGVGAATDGLDGISERFEDSNDNFADDNFDDNDFAITNIAVWQGASISKNPSVQVQVQGYPEEDNVNINDLRPTSDSESSGSFVNGGKCDLKTKTCTGNVPATGKTSFGTFLAFLSGRHSLMTNRTPPRPNLERPAKGIRKKSTKDNRNIDDADDDDRLLVRVAHWLDDNKFSLLIGGGLATALYFLSHNKEYRYRYYKHFFSRQPTSSICDACKSRCLPKSERCTS